MFNIGAAIESAQNARVEVWVAGAATSDEVDLLELSLGHHGFAHAGDRLAGESHGKRRHCVRLPRKRASRRPAAVRIRTVQSGLPEV